MREGPTENATVVGALLSDLLQRGLDFSTPRLYVLDGAKALHTAVRRHAGEAAFIQRCQVHKKRNVVDHLPEEHKAEVRRKLQSAYSMADYEDSRRALERLHHELMHLNPSAARSLEQGLEERSPCTGFEFRINFVVPCPAPTSSSRLSRLSKLSAAM